jgi:HSP20 family protein
MKKDLTTRLRDDFLPTRHIGDPILSFQKEMDRLFRDFFEVEPFGQRLLSTFPEIDVKETEKEMRVSAELPGMEEKDVEVLLDSDSLTIRGEKKHEEEEKGESYYRSERRYGSFCRVIPLTSEVESDKVEAKFKNGVLTVTIPKTEKARADVKKITIKH